MKKIRITTQTSVRRVGQRLVATTRVSNGKTTRITTKSVHIRKH